MPGPEIECRDEGCPHYGFPHSHGPSMVPQLHSTRRERGPRPKYSTRVTREDYLNTLAVWAGVNYCRWSMHETAANAIEKAAEYREQLDKLEEHAVHLASGGHDADAIRYSRRDVEGLVAIALAAQSTKKE